MNTNKSYVEPASAALLLLIGAAAGAALAATVLSSPLKDKISAAGVKGVIPDDLLSSAAQKLAETRDKLVAAIDKSTA